jgi:hypothetical protein
VVVRRQRVNEFVFDMAGARQVALLIAVVRTPATVYEFRNILELSLPLFRFYRQHFALVELRVLLKRATWRSKLKEE